MKRVGIAELRLLIDEFLGSKVVKYNVRVLTRLNIIAF